MNESVPNTPPQQTDAFLKPPASHRGWLWWLASSLLIMTAAFVLITCGGSGSTSQNTPTSPSPSAGWPVVPATSIGVSISYPPELKAAKLNDFRVGFSPDVIDTDTDAAPPIVFSVYQGRIEQRRQEIRGYFSTVSSDNAERLGTSNVVRLVGRLKPDIFGWGGTIHGYVVLEVGEQVVVVDYDAEDQSVVQSVNQMVERMTR